LVRRVILKFCSGKQLADFIWKLDSFNIGIDVLLECDDYDRSFDSEEALQQQLRDSPAHARSFDCETCDLWHRGDLEQHLRDSRIHQQDTETPLDAPFLGAGGPFQPLIMTHLPPATSYANLREYEG
jgi:hypothetical protein